VIRSWSNPHVAQDAERSPVAATPQWFDWVATIYVLVIASGALGCLDVIASGMTEDGQIVNTHPFNKGVNRREAAQFRRVNGLAWTTASVLSIGMSARSLATSV
jgi:hypothetical protein